MTELYTFHADAYSDWFIIDKLIVCWDIICYSKYNLNKYNYDMTLKQ